MIFERFLRVAALAKLDLWIITVLQSLANEDFLGKISPGA